MFITKANFLKEDLKYKWRVLVPVIVKVGPVDVGYVVVVLVLSSVLDAVVEEWSRVVYPLGIPSSK